MPERKIKSVYFMEKSGKLHHRGSVVDLSDEEAKRADEAGATEGSGPVVQGGTDTALMGSRDNVPDPEIGDDELDDDKLTEALEDEEGLVVEDEGDEDVVEAERPPQPTPAKPNRRTAKAQAKKSDAGEAGE